MDRNPKISVCIPTYNGAKYIKQQLDSILMQLGSDDEIIISDDRSTDDTIKIIRSFNDERIKIFTHQQVANNHRDHYWLVYQVAKNVENTLEQASGDYIFLSDQDDVWLPGKVETMVAEMEKGFDIVQHDATVVNENGKVVYQSIYSKYHLVHSLRYFLYGGMYQGSAMAFTKRLKDIALPFCNSFPIGHDHIIAAVALAANMKMSYIEQSFLLYRRHGANVSHTSGKSNNSLYFKISYRFNQIFHYLRSKFSR